MFSVAGVQQQRSQLVIESRVALADLGDSDTEWNGVLPNLLVVVRGGGELVDNAPGASNT